ncbi:MAG: ECF transporter S component [Clostridia bacterium]|nr:ECF transporter S component [Clostridia bacterium]
MAIKSRNDKIFKLVMTALLFAIIIVLQLIGGSVKIGGTSFSFVLLPIVVGALTLGPSIGAFLGLTFGVMTVLAGVTAQDFFTATLIQYEPVFTVLVCLVKATLAGYVPGIVWKALRNKNELVAVFLAAASAPVVNTGIFIAGGLLFFGEALTEAGFLGGQSLVYFLVIGCAGINFIAELAVNLLLAPAIHSLIRAFGSMFKK